MDMSHDSSIFYTHIMMLSRRGYFLKPRSRVCFEAIWAVEQYCAALFVGETMWGTKAFILMKEKGTEPLSLWSKLNTFVLCCTYCFPPSCTQYALYSCCVFHCSKHLRACVGIEARCQIPERPTALHAPQLVLSLLPFPSRCLSAL